MRHAARVLLTLLAAGALVSLAPAKEPAAKDVIIKTLPGIVVDTKAREVRLEGTVCLQEGALELFVCSEGTREHESVIVVKAKPSHVTFALALLGLPPGKPGFVTEGGAFSPPAGEVVTITARFTPKGGKQKEVPAWKLLRLSGMEEGLDRPFDWVYIGRPEADAMKAADREGTVVCIANFLEAVIDVPFESTSVNSNLAYEANPRVVPKPGTPVELIIRPTGRRIEPKKVQAEVVLKKGAPPELDGRPMSLEALKSAVNGMPAVIRTTVLRADPDERFGRVMQVNDILRDALMRVRLVVLKPPSAAPGQTGPPLEIVVTADEKVRLGETSLAPKEFCAKVKDLLKGAKRVRLKADAKASMKTVAEVMAAVRDQGAAVSLTTNAPGKPGG